MVLQRPAPPPPAPPGAVATIHTYLLMYYDRHRALPSAPRRPIQKRRGVDIATPSPGRTQQ